MFWLMGVFMMALREVVHVTALSYGNQVLLSSSSSITIIHNTILSVVFLKETLHKTDVIAISMICMGSMAFLTIAHNDNVQLTSDVLPDLYLSGQSIVFLIVSFFLIIFANISDTRAKSQLKEFAAKKNLQISDVVKEK